MQEAVVVALISGVSGILAGVWGRGKYERTTTTSSSSGNGTEKLETVIARRADVEFQTRMTILMEKLTNAIEKGHDKASGQLAMVSEAITEAADTVRELHRQIAAHRSAVDAVAQRTEHTHQLVLDLHSRSSEQRTAH